MASMPWFPVDHRRAGNGKLRYSYGPADKIWSFRAWSGPMASLSLQCKGYLWLYSYDAHQLWHNKVPEQDLRWGCAFGLQN